MINLERLLYSNAFSQTFTVTRKNGALVNGRFNDVPESFQVQGIIRPANTNDLKMLPEGDRVTGIIIVYTKEALLTTRAAQGLNSAGLKDEVTWNGEQYLVFQTAGYSDFGYYKSMAVRKKGA